MIRLVIDLDFQEGIFMNDNMVDTMKKKLSAKSITAMVLFGAIILVFVFMGLPGANGPSIGSVARVNDSLISIADFQQEQNRVQQYYKGIFGDQMDLSPQRQMMEQQALENLVRSELVYQAATAEKIYATDAEVRHFIVKEIPFFQQNGAFQKDFYLNYLEQTRSTPNFFETKVRKDVANIRTRGLFEAAMTQNALEKAKHEEMKKVKVNVSFVHIDTAKTEADIGKEKAEAAFKALDEALVKGDEALVEEQVKVLKAKWDETGLADLSLEQLPKLNSQEANVAAFGLSKTKPMVASIVRDGNNKYILKLKEFKVDESATTAEKVYAEMTLKRKADSLFESWVAKFRANSKVVVNDHVFKMN